jgi:NitT/TauT family transport system substrate-binding protein
MRKLALTLALAMSLILAACGPGAPATPTPGPTATVPAAPPTRGAPPVTTPTGTAAPPVAATATTGAPAPPSATAGAAISPTATISGPGAGALTPDATPPLTVTVTPQATVTGTTGLTKVQLVLAFQPNVQFAPFYVAQDKGYYAAEGLDVQVQYSTAPDALTLLGSGSSDFVVTSGDEMVPARVQGIPVTYIMAQYQRYPVGATAISGNGPPLKTPADLKGRNVGLPGEYGSSLVALKALLQAGHLTDSDIKISSIGFTQVEALSQKRVDVAMTYLMNEPVQLQKLGHEVETLNVSDYLNLVSVGLATSERNLKERPDLVQHFVNATLRGLRDTLDHPEDAFTSSVKRTPEVTGDGLILQRAVLSATLTFMQPPAGHPLGWSDPAGWQTTQDFLKSVNMIDKTVDPATVYTNQFVEAARP